MLILMDKQSSHILGEVVARGRCGKGELVVEVEVHLLGNRSVVEVVVVVVEVHLLGNKSVVAVRGGVRNFCLRGPNFFTNILVSSQDKPSHSGINTHSQI